MPRTFSQLQADVAGYVQAPNDGEALGIAGSGINSAIQYMNQRNWSWQLTSYPFAWVAGTPTYNLPSDFRAPRSLVSLNTAGEVACRIGYEDPKTFDHNYGHSTPDVGGDPSAYTVFDTYPSGVITVDTSPNASYIETSPSGQIRYYARITELTADTDQLVVPPEVEFVITWFAKSYMAATYNPEKVGYADSRWSATFRQLRRNETEDTVTDWR